MDDADAHGGNTLAKAHKAMHGNRWPRRGRESMEHHSTMHSAAISYQEAFVSCSYSMPEQHVAARCCKVTY